MLRACRPKCRDQARGLSFHPIWHARRPDREHRFRRGGKGENGARLSRARQDRRIGGISGPCDPPPVRDAPDRRYSHRTTQPAILSAQPDRENSEGSGQGKIESFRASRAERKGSLGGGVGAFLVAAWPFGTRSERRGLGSDPSGPPFPDLMAKNRTSAGDNAPEPIIPCRFGKRELAGPRLPGANGR